ncbi:MAG: nickel-binding protein [Ginsengibacter sp.]
MALYMDRHDVSPAVTAENVAELHRQDLKIQHLYNCRGLTYWFDEKRSTAFCLIDAPDKQSLQEMHAKAHGQVPNQIIEVEASIVESFLGRIEDPEMSQNTELNIINDPAFRTIMAVKISRNTQPESQSNLADSREIKWKNTICKLILNFEGKIVKQTDNYFLVSFKSVSKAINCSRKIRSSLRGFIKKLGEKDFNLKIGISAGVPVNENEFFFEDTIKLANRLSQVPYDSILISSEVKDLYYSENANTFLKTKSLFFSFFPADEKIFTQLFDFMESSYSNAFLTIHDFVKSLGMSKSKLYRKVLLFTGKSLTPFIRDYRLNEALILLKQNKHNLSEVAYQTGFTSLSYFSKCFHKKYGEVPSALL